MNHPPAQPKPPTTLSPAELRSRLLEQGQIRLKFSDGGQLSLDRRLPFLCLYRRPVDAPDAGTEKLLLGEAAYFLASAAEAQQPELSTLVQSIIELMSGEFGAFLLLEIWSASEEEVASAVDIESGEPLPLRPAFTIHHHIRRVPHETVDALAQALRSIKVQRQPAQVEIVVSSKPAPAMLPLAVSPSAVKARDCFFLGLEVLPIYRNRASGEIYPAILRALRRGVGQALKQAFFSFTQTHTNISARHYHSLGPRALQKSVWEVDGQLAEIGEAFDLLWQATPNNAEAAWREFRRSRFEKPPAFLYRPAAVEPTLIKRRLFQVPLERVEDPTLVHLFREKQDELDRKITMLGDIGSPRFRAGSLQVYGAVDASLLSVAEEILRRVSPQDREETGKQVSAQHFARLANKEIAYYRQMYPQFSARAIVREDMFSGLLVSHGHLLIGQKTLLAASRVEPLLHHEIGTHLVTYYNGYAQPFRLLEVGLAGYDVLQEGLAVLSEHLGGGLSPARLRLLAARVVAVDQMLAGATFVDTFRLLHQTYEFSQRLAYTVAMRVYRGGGLTKDLIYLKGLMQMLRYLGEGGTLEPLLIGKIAAVHLPLISELRHRQVLLPPPLRPRYLDDPPVAGRLKRLARGLSVLELLEDRQP